MSAQRIRPRTHRGEKLHVIRYLFLFAAVVFSTAATVAGEDAKPLEAADTSSPRATLRSFREGSIEIYRLIKEHGVKVRTSEGTAVVSNRIFRCLNLSEAPEALKNDIAAEATVCLMEVLDRVDLPPESKIPDAAAMTALIEAGELPRWTIPRTEITIAEVLEGPRTGEFLISPSTVARANHFYHRVKHVDYKPDAVTPGFYDWYLSEPGWMIPTAWVHSLPRWTRKIVFEQTVWQWIGLLLTLLLGIAALTLTYKFGRRRAQYFGRTSNVLGYCRSLVWSIAAMAIPLAMKYFIAGQLSIRGTPLAITKISLDVVFLVTVVVVLIAAANRLAEVIIASPKIHPKGIDAQLIRLAFRFGGIVAAAFVVIDGGQKMGIPLTTLLAGAGVGGLTIALAAQDTLKNLFGSMMIILDRPYRVGERILVKGYDGVVEEIGLRSTKIRLLTGHQATIPNEEMARTDVENVGRRPHIRRIEDLALPFDTPPEKAEEAVAIIRELLDDHEGAEADFPPRVFFNEFNRDSLNVRIIYWYHPPNYWDFMAYSQQLNTQIMRKFAAAGIRFALPATTTYMSQGDDAPLQLNVLNQPGRKEST